MNADTRQQLKEVGGTVAIIGAVLAAGILSVPSPKTITLKWDVNNPPGSVVTEVWTSTNLADWTKYADVSGSNIVVPATNPAAFFKVRNRDSFTGELSDWARKR